MTRRRGGGGRPGGNRNGGGRRGGRGNGGPISGPIGRAAGQSFRTPKGRSGGRGGGPRGGGRNPNGRRNGTTPSQRRRGNDQSNAKPNDTKSTTKDPIDVVTGEVLLSQTDVDLPGVLPLLLERTHISTYGAGHLFGRTWASTLDQHLELDSEGVYYLTEDARVLKFPQALLPNVQFRPVAGPQWPLVLTSDGGYTLTDPQLGRTLHFPAPGEEHGWTRLPLTAISDRNGNRIDFLYDDQVLVEVRHSGGYRIAVDSVPLDAESSRAERRVTALRLLTADAQADDITLIRFGYDAEGDLAEVINSSGRPLRFTYDDEGRLTGWTDRNDFWYRYEYDEEGRAVRGIGKDGHLSATLVYDPDNRVTRVTDSLGHTTTYRYNELYQVVEETGPLGNTTRSEWDRHDQLLSSTDPLGRTFRYSYDEQGNLLTVTRPDGSTTAARYNELNLPIEITQADDAVWRQEYDERGNLIRLIDPTGAESRYVYDRHGALITATDALGNVTRLQNGIGGSPVGIVDPLGGTTRCAYDPLGRPTALTDPVGGTTSFGWTPEGGLAWRSLPDGTTERWTYDPEGNEVEHIDALGQVHHTEYGAFDVPVARTRPDGSRLVFTHDTELRLLTATNAQGLSWRYEYDARGALTAETDFNGRTLKYGYDQAGQLVSRTNGAGQTVTFARDRLGRVVEKRSGEAVTAFTYDPLGRLLRAVAPDADLRFERDAAGRVTSEVCNGATVLLPRDALGRRVGRRTPSGTASHWSYNAAGQPNGLAFANHDFKFAHDPAGRETERRIGTGAILAQQWDANHRLTAQTLWGAPTGQGQARLLQHRSYAYRADGKATGVGDRLVGDRRLALDPVGRITAVRARDWTERYAYDAIGNLTAAEWPAGHGSPAGADADGDRAYSGTLVRRAGRVVFEHDDQGRVVQRRQTTLSGKRITWRYHWDADDRLIGVETPGGQKWRYGYDPLGRRVSKQRLSADGRGVNEQFAFAWDGAVLAEQIHHVWSQERQAFTSRVTTWEYEPDGFRPVAQAEVSQTDRRFYAIVTDLIGTPTELVDPGGTVVWHRRATVWDHSLESTATPCPLRFPGQYFDTETGLSYNYERYYDSTTANYASPDPLGLAPQPNPHTYVENPLRQADPLGLAPYDFQNPHAAFKHYSKHSKGVIIGNNGNVRPKPGGPDMPEYTNFRDYRDAAGQFMGRDTPHGAIEMIRPRDGAVVRYHPGSGNFGIRTPDGVIRTFFRPDGNATERYQYFRDQIV